MRRTEVCCRGRRRNRYLERGMIIYMYESLTKEGDYGIPDDHLDDQIHSAPMPPRIMIPLKSKGIAWYLAIVSPCVDGRRTQMEGEKYSLLSYLPKQQTNTAHCQRKIQVIGTGTG
jgi:hypothetical protein